MKSEIMHSVLAVVTDICEVSAEEILSKCKKDNVVDARCIFVSHYRRLGISTANIMEFLGRSRRCVINSYLERHRTFLKLSFNYRYMNKKVSEKLAEIYPESVLKS